MGKHRANGEGSICKVEGRDRPWYARFSDGNGRRPGRYFKTQGEARAWLKEKLGQVDRGEDVPAGEERLAAFLARWLETVAPTVRPSTWRHYSQLVEQYISPEIGRMRLRDLRSDRIEGLLARLRTSGMGAGTLRIVRAVLNRACKWGVRNRVLGRNPVDGIERPRLPRREMAILQADQVSFLLETIADDQFRLLLDVAIATGMRQGELLALQWSDVDWDAGALQVQRQVQRPPGGGVLFSEPKSTAGRRRIDVTPAMVARLRQHRLKQFEAFGRRAFAGDRWQEGNLIFCTGVGTPLDASKIRRQMSQALAAAGLPAIRFHDLRHTAASLMLAAGVGVKLVQQRLGHSSASLTLDVYSHVMPGQGQDAAQRLEDLLAGGDGGKLVAPRQKVLKFETNGET